MADINLDEVAASVRWLNEWADIRDTRANGAASADLRKAAAFLEALSTRAEGVNKFLQETFVKVPLGTGSVVIGKGTLGGSAAVFFEAVAKPGSVGADATNSETGLAENRIAPGSVVITFDNIESAHVLLEAIEDRIQAMSISQQGEDR